MVKTPRQALENLVAACQRVPLHRPETARDAADRSRFEKALAQARVTLGSTDAEGGS
jgi:hypothetical protein